MSGRLEGVLARERHSRPPSV